MKSRQLGFVLMALIAVGVAGLIIRVVSSVSSESVLAGLLPISQDVVNRVTIRSDTGEARLVKVGETWTVDNQPVFLPKLARFWTAVSDIDGARLIANNPANHERMGVAKGQGAVISFYLGDFLQEGFLLGTWSPDVNLCYLRRPGKPEVYAIECPDPASEIFDSNPSGWRNPIIAAIPREEVESIAFAFPDTEFVLKMSNGDWVVDSGQGEKPADTPKVNRLLSVLQAVVASGFAEAAETKGLSFDAPDASVRVVTKKGATVPTTRLIFLRRDERSYFIKTPGHATVFILDRVFSDELLKTKEDFLSTGQ